MNRSSFTHSSTLEAASMCFLLFGREVASDNRCVVPAIKQTCSAVGGLCRRSCTRCQICSIWITCDAARSHCYKISAVVNGKTHLDRGSRPIRSCVRHPRTPRHIAVWAIERPMEENNQPRVRKVHHEDVWEGVAWRGVVQGDRGGQLFMPVDQCEATVSTDRLVAHLISLMAPV